jgi:hypothetical protein
MAEFAFAIPVLPGKEELDRKTLGEMRGARRDEYEAAARRAGITRQIVWHQQSPEGTIAVVYVEADNPAAALGEFGSSDEPFNSWFRDQMKEVHGVDISEPGPPAEKVFDAKTS